MEDAVVSNDEDIYDEIKINDDNRLVSDIEPLQNEILKIEGVDNENEVREFEGVDAENEGMD